jgi:tRNA pseudouridine13 synthase
LQSLLFNYTLKLRLERGLYDRVLVGDWAKKHDTGGVFLVEDADAESERVRRLEISATLPLYGKKVRVATGEAGALEAEVLDYFGLRWADFTGRKGSRRITRVLLQEAGVEPTEDGYTLSFTLPKGSFATTVLREVMKVEVDEPVEIEDGED